MKHYRLFRIAALAVFFSLALSLTLGASDLAAADAATIIVNTLVDSNGTPCTSTQCITLRSAIRTAASGDTIKFKVSGTIHLKSPLTISKNLMIDGRGQNITLSGDTNGDGTGDVQVMMVNAGVSLDLRNLKIVNGKASDGAGVDNKGTLNVSNVTFSNNRADVEGGAILNNGSLSVTGSKFWQNSAGSGGGIANGAVLTVTDSTFSGNYLHPTHVIFTEPGGGGIWSDGTLAVTNSTFSGNRAIDRALDGLSPGGGISNYGTLYVASSIFLGNSTLDDGGGISTYYGTVNVSNSVFAQNKAYAGVGGGISNDGGVMSLTKSTFSNNYSPDGGGIHNGGSLNVSASTFSKNSALSKGAGISNYGMLNLTNTTFSRNSAGGYGGGILDAYSVGLTIASSTFSGNHAQFGGGIYIRGSPSVTLQSAIIANTDSGGDCGEYSATFTDGGYNLADDGTCQLSTAKHSLANTNPLLDPAGLKNNGGPTETIALQGASPARDAVPVGVNGCGTTITTDQRGIARPQGTACDIGAFEYSTGGQD